MSESINQCITPPFSLPTFLLDSLSMTFWNLTPPRSILFQRRSCHARHPADKASHPEADSASFHIHAPLRLPILEGLYGIAAVAPHISSCLCLGHIDTAAIAFKYLSCTLSFIRPPSRQLWSTFQFDPPAHQTRIKFE
jgi:hypothetical protein